MKIRSIFLSVLMFFAFISVSFAKVFIYSEDSVYPLLKTLSTKFTQQTHIKVNLRLVESVSTLKYLFKQSNSPNLIFSEDTYLLKRLNIKSEQIALDPIVIVYNKNYNFNDKNWMEIVNKVGYGYSNPNADPLGYYVNFIFELYNKINHTNYICKSKYLRDETTQLFWLMKSGNLNIIFTYKSFAIQNHLKYFELPSLYNLTGNYDYSQVSYKLDNGEIIPGHQSSFGMGIIKDTKDTEEFIKFIKSKSNQKFFNELGLIQS